MCLAGGVLLSGGQDKTVKMWSLERTSAVAVLSVEKQQGAPSGGVPTVNTPIATLTHGASVQGLGLSAVAGFIVSAGGRGAKRLIVWQPHDDALSS